MLAIIVHGGMEDTNLPEEALKRRLAGTKKACDIGYETLVRTGSPHDAVEAAIHYLEDDPYFDAGTGSYFNLCGEIEMDAAIMDSTGKGAGIACIKNVQHPISVARKVMEDTPHVLIVGEGAELFARSHGFPEYDPSTEMTREFLQEQIEKLPQEMRAIMDRYNKMRSQDTTFSTVGAVAVDSNGMVVAATSTGGIPQKLPGRVGDTPILGAGTFASEAGGASATGHGESVIRLGATRALLARIADGTKVQDACTELTEYGRKHKATFGLIALDKQGIGGASHNGVLMPVYYRSEASEEAIELK